jgi:hypothetical protein
LISETSITNLNRAISDAERQDPLAVIEKLRFLLRPIPSGQSDLDNLQQNVQMLQNQGYTYPIQALQGLPASVTSMAAASEISRAVYPIFAARDQIMRSVKNSIEAVCPCKVLL